MPLMTKDLTAKFLMAFQKSDYNAEVNVNDVDIATTGFSDYWLLT
jgi:hypothetical protein